MEKVKKYAEMYPVFKKIEKSTKGQIPAEQAFIAVTAIFFVLLFVRPISSAFTNLCAVLFIISPALAILNSRVAPDTGMVKHVVSYLLTFLIYCALDSLFPFMQRKFPLYYQVKFVFFYYLSVRRMQLTEYINANLYSTVHELIAEINSVDKGEKIKSAQTAAHGVISESVDAMKDAPRPKKEE
jgi:hypothetical protein